MEIIVWLVILIFYGVIKVAKVSTKSNMRGTTRSNVPRNTTPAKSTYKREQPQVKSFAAMPKQQSGIPNVESNCAADDKHRYENNISGHHTMRASAVPNKPASYTQAQPKMSGNRKAARQRYMGDSIPQGTRVITCSYCAAENIVPYNARNEYKCYFCHYDI